MATVWDLSMGSLAAPYEVRRRGSDLGPARPFKRPRTGTAVQTRPPAWTYLELLTFPWVV